MDAYFMLKAIGFLSLVITGIPANGFVLLRFANIWFLEKKLLPSNIIRMALMLANLFVLLSRVLLQALNSAGIKNLLNDRQCKLFIFVFRVSRAMSICVTSFLSCHQCILIAPASGKWEYMKQVMKNKVPVIIIILLGMNMALYPSGILFGWATANATLSPYTLRLVYCDVDFLNYAPYVINGSLYVIREVICVSLMILSSSYMLYILYRHGQSMKGMRSSDKGQSKTMEYKASRAVIFLVAMYIALYGMDNSAWIYTLTMSNVDPDVSDTRLFLAASFAVFSPIHIFATTPKLHFTLWHKYPWRKQYTEKCINISTKFQQRDTLQNCHNKNLS